EEVYVCQPLGFEDPDHPDKVHKVVKALYGLHQAPKAWLTKGKSASTPIDTDKPLLKDPNGKDVDVHIYRSMIVKRIFRYLKGKPHLGLWYLKDSPFDLVAYSDSDYAGASLDRKSTTGGCYFKWIGVFENDVKCFIYLKCWLSHHTTNGSQFTMSNPNKNWLVQIKRSLNQLGDLLTHSTKYISPALTQKVFANMRRVGKGCSRVETPLLEGMLVARELEEQGDAEEHGSANNAAEEPVTAASEDDEALDACATLAIRVKHLEHDKVAQELEIIKLKTRVKKLERANKAKTLKLKRLRKVGTSQRVDTLDDTIIKDGRQADIYQIDMDHAAKVLSIQEDESEVQEAVEVVTTVKLITKVVAAVSEIVIAAAVVPAAVTEKVSAAAVVPTDESFAKTPTETKSKDKGKAKFNANMEFLLKSKEQIKEETNRAIESINETPAQKAAKRRRLNEEAKDVEELKQHLEIMPDEDDDVYTKATPLARKVPVVDY
nr:hypothetical protein [Tanacetum cinerariifolium]